MLAGPALVGVMTMRPDHHLIATAIAFAVAGMLSVTTLTRPIESVAIGTPLERSQTFRVSPFAQSTTDPRDNYTVVTHVAVWPVDTADAHLGSLFGQRTPPTEGASSYHEGVDFTPGANAPIHAMASGLVTAAGGPRDGLGWYVMITSKVDGQQIETVYGHMIRRPSVHVGDAVTIDQQLGNVGSTGISTGPHLHFEIHVNGVAVDPLPWLRDHTAR